MAKQDLHFHENNREHYEFLPAALEVLETPPIPFGRIIAITIATFFVLAVLWGVWGTIDVVAISTGRTIPAGNVKIIQPFETGVVRAIHVQDGDNVQQGDLLLELDPTESVANLDSLRIEKKQAEVDVAVGYALLQEDPTSSFVPPENIDSITFAMAKRQIAESYVRYISELNALKNEVLAIRATKDASIIERQKIKEILPIIEEQLKANKALYGKEFMSRVEVQRLEREFIELKAALSSAVQTEKQAMASIESNLSRINGVTANYRSQAIEQQQNALKSLDLLEQSIRKEQQRLEYRELRAPVDGVVQQLSIHTIGAVVDTGASLLVVVPKNTPLEIETMVLNKDIGFIEKGQITEIKFEAFPFTRYGTLSGKLISVSDDAIIHEQLGPVYKAKVSLDTQQIIVDGKPINLSPGMNVSVEVKTAVRRIINFFLSPLLRYKDEAIRER